MSQSLQPSGHEQSGAGQVELATGAPHKNSGTVQPPNVTGLTELESVDATFILDRWARDPVIVRAGRGVYPIKQGPEANWIWHAFRGFDRLVETRMIEGPRSFASVGAGLGLDAVGASLIFPELQRIVVTELDADVAGLAGANVRRNVSPDVAVVSLVGDVCYPIRLAGEKVDLIYANLPTLPAPEDQLDCLDHGTFYIPSEEDVCGAELEAYFLGLQYRFLRSAADVLTPNGRIVLMLGGRYPLRLLDELATAGGYHFDEVLACLKLQSEVKTTTLGYARHEQEIQLGAALWQGGLMSVR